MRDLLIYLTNNYLYFSFLGLQMSLFSYFMKFEMNAKMMKTKCFHNITSRVIEGQICIQKSTFTLLKYKCIIT